jgi:hypothetical protein
MDDRVPLLGRGQDEAPEARCDVPPTTGLPELQSQGTHIKQILATSVVQCAMLQCTPTVCDTPMGVSQTVAP